MKTKILSIIMLLFISFGIPNVKAQNNENNAFNKEYTNIDDFVLNLLTEDTSIELKLNRNLPVYIGKGQVLNFHFTPEDNMYYVIETVGDIDTKLKIENTASGTIINDDGGIGFDARIGFQAIPNQKINIYLKCYSDSTSGTTILQIRKQRFSMFGYKENNGVNTIKDLEVPYSSFKSKFDSVKYENTSASHALDIDERSISKLNSEIVFFSGHGYKDGSGISFKEGDIRNYTEFNLNRTKVAMWAACHSADSNNYLNMSFAEYAVKRGAKSSVGFKNSINENSSKTFTNRFFEKLAIGNSVAEAAKYGADGLLWPWDNAKDYVIFGDSSLKVITPTLSINTFNYSIPTDYINVLNDIEQNDFLKVNSSDDNYRYYELINGYMTNSYIDIAYANNEIININDQRKPYKIVLSINSAYTNKNFGNYEIEEYNYYNSNNVINKNIIYYNFNGVMTPIEISSMEYINDINAYLKTRCVNLHTGETIDYSRINESDK